MTQAIAFMHDALILALEVLCVSVIAASTICVLHGFWLFLQDMGTDKKEEGE